MKLKNKKAQVGMEVLLSLIAMIFVIGLLVMIFVMMSSSLATASFDKLTSVSVINESVTSSKTAGLHTNLSGLLARDGVCGNVTKVINGTDNQNIVVSSNFTIVGCSVNNATSMTQWGTNLFFTYSYTYSADNEATRTINSTGQDVAGVTQYFSLFITIGAMVTLILLTVLIIVAIRSSGLMQKGTA